MKLQFARVPFVQASEDFVREFSIADYFDGLWIYNHSWMQTKKLRPSNFSFAEGTEAKHRVYEFGYPVAATPITHVHDVQSLNIEPKANSFLEQRT